MASRRFDRMDELLKVVPVVDVGSAKTRVSIMHYYINRNLFTMTTSASKEYLIRVDWIERPSIYFCFYNQIPIILLTPLTLLPRVSP